MPNAVFFQRHLKLEIALCSKVRQESLYIESAKRLGEAQDLKQREVRVGRILSSVKAGLESQLAQVKVTEEDAKRAERNQDKIIEEEHSFLSSVHEPLCKP